MQTINAYFPKTSAPLLEDIFNNIQIDTMGGIWHRRYPKQMSTPEFVAHLEQLPGEMRHRYLTLQLRSFLQAFYFQQLDWSLPDDIDTADLNLASCNRTSLDINSDVASSPRDPNDRDVAGIDEVSSAQTLQNNVYKGLDIAFYEALKRSNCGQGYFDEGWKLLEKQEARFVVIKHGLTLEAQRDWQVSPAHRNAQVGDRIALLLPPNQIESDYYIAIGNAGLPPHASVQRSSQTRGSVVHCFFNLQASSACALMDRVTRHFNDRKLPFRLQLLNAPDLYEERCDTGVLRITRQHYTALKPWLENLAQDLSLIPESLPLTQTLVPGISVAEVPRQPAPGKHWSAGKIIPFAQHRCEAIATALMQTVLRPAHTETQDQKPASKKQFAEALEQSFQQFEIDWKSPYLNAGSPTL